MRFSFKIDPERKSYNLQSTEGIFVWIIKLRFARSLLNFFHILWKTCRSYLTHLLFSHIECNQTKQQQQQQTESRLESKDWNTLRILLKYFTMAMLIIVHVAPHTLVVLVFVFSLITFLYYYNISWPIGAAQVC